MRSDPNQLLTTAVLATVVAVATVRPVRGEGDDPTTPLPTLVFVRPGTRVGETPPVGWSHLVLKALPRVASGDVETLPSIGATTATRFRSFVLADVRRAGGGSPGFVLKRIGLGLSVPAEGGDTVVSGGEPSLPPEALGFVERQVLARAEVELKKARLVARSPTFAVLAAPTDLKVGASHEKVYLFYAMLVNAKTGRLDTWLWSIAAGAERRTEPDVIIRLAQGLIYPCGLDVLADRLLGTIPVGWSFAMQALPPGRRLATPPPLAPWLVDPERIASKPVEFERLLRAEVVPGGDDGRTAPESP